MKLLWHKALTHIRDKPFTSFCYGFTAIVGAYMLLQLIAGLVVTLAFLNFI